MKHTSRFAVARRLNAVLGRRPVASALVLVPAVLALTVALGIGGCFDEIEQAPTGGGGVWGSMEWGRDTWQSAAE